MFNKYTTNSIKITKWPTTIQFETFEILCDICSKKDFSITRQILLQAHASKNVNLSYSGLQQRINQLIKKGYLENYYGKILPTLVGIRKFGVKFNNETYYQNLKDNILHYKAHLRAINH